MSPRKAWSLPPSPNPHPCDECGVTVRTVLSTEGDLVKIDLEPDPNGTVIPWPAPTPTGTVQARIITVPVTDQDAWCIHCCR